MKLGTQPKTMQPQVLVVSMTAALLLTAAAPSRAAPAAPAKTPAATAATAQSAQSARKCLTDLNAFQTQMQKDGYWRGGTGYGYGYPMDGYGYGYGYGDYNASTLAPITKRTGEPIGSNYLSARPGYEVRTLLAATQILGQRGQQGSCETLLGQTREVYVRYAAQVRSGHVARDDAAGFRQAQLAAAQPVAGKDVSYRSDQLIGTEVLDPKGEELGSVDDLVLSPQTGKIAYLVIARGGLFGIDQKHVPVPWGHVKATAGANILVLDTTKADMAAAPHVKEDRFSAVGDFAKQSQQVDIYWSAHPVR